MIYRILLALLLGLASFTCVAATKITIQWQTFHFPPLYMMNGEFAGQGYMDKVLALTIAEMLDFEHELPLSTHTRALAEIQQGRPTCHPALFKTAERQAYAVFSKPSFVTPANRLIVSNRVKAKYQLNEPVNLQDILTRHQFSVALIANRAYGSAIDEVLNNYVEDNILRMPITKSSVIFQLLYRDKIDAAIAFPFELSYFESTHSAKDEMAAMVIQNTIPYVVGHIACPDNPWGHNVVNAVNRALARLVNRKEYLLAMTTWWREELDKPAFKSFYQEALLAEYVD